MFLWLCAGSELAAEKFELEMHQQNELELGDFAAGNEVTAVVVLPAIGPGGAELSLTLCMPVRCSCGADAAASELLDIVLLENFLENSKVKAERW